MKVEVNQSNKIEQTNKDTIIGLANDKTFTILIKARIKRKLQEEFRKQGKPRLFVYRTFIAGIILALKYAQLRNFTRVVIDEEYYSKDKLLKSIFLEMWRDKAFSVKIKKPGYLSAEWIRRCGIRRSNLIITKQDGLSIGLNENNNKGKKENY